MKLADKKVKKYLDRALNIYNESIPSNPIETYLKTKSLENKLSEKNIIEIAKMIQKEEHYDPWEDK